MILHRLWLASALVASFASLTLFTMPLWAQWTPVCHGRNPVENQLCTNVTQCHLQGCQPADGQCNDGSCQGTGCPKIVYTNSVRQGDCVVSQDNTCVSCTTFYCALGHATNDPNCTDPSAWACWLQFFWRPACDPSGTAPPTQPKRPRTSFQHARFHSWGVSILEDLCLAVWIPACGSGSRNRQTGGKGAQRRECLHI